MNFMEKQKKTLFLLFFVLFTINCFSNPVRFNDEDYLLEGTKKDNIPVLLNSGRYILKKSLLKNGFSIARSKLFFLGKEVNPLEARDIVDHMLTIPRAIDVNGFLYHSVADKPVFNDGKYENMSVLDFVCDIQGNKISIVDLEKYGFESINGRLIKDNVFYTANQAKSLISSIDLPSVISKKISELTEKIFLLDFDISEKSRESFVAEKGICYRSSMFLRNIDQEMTDVSEKINLKNIINLFGQVTTLINEFIRAEITLAGLFDTETDVDEIYNTFSRLVEIHGLFTIVENEFESVVLEEKKSLLSVAYDSLIFAKNSLLFYIKKPIETFVVSFVNLNKIKNFLTSHGVRHTIKAIEGTVVAGSLYIFTVFVSTDMEMEIARGALLALVSAGIISYESVSLIRR